MGIHFLAGTRYLLGDERVARVAAFTRGVSPSLPPLDTLDAVLQAESGLQGSVQIALSSSLPGSGWTVVGEHGYITVTEVSVTSKIRGCEEVKEFTADLLAVPSEVRAWGEALAKGTPNTQQTPEQGLADLELVSLSRFPRQEYSPMRSRSRRCYGVQLNRGSRSPRSIRWRDECLRNASSLDFAIDLI